VQRVDRELDIGVASELAALAGALERRAHRAAPRRDDVAVEALREVRVVLEVADETCHHVAPGRPVEHGDEPAEQRNHVLAGRARGRRWRHRVRAREVRLEDERRLRRPPAVDRLLADAGAGGDPLDRQLGVAALDEELLRGDDDRLVRALAAAASARIGGGHGRHHSS
jgi:hypothetical protein